MPNPFLPRLVRAMFVLVALFVVPPAGAITWISNSTCVEAVYVVPPAITKLHVTAIDNGPLRPHVMETGLVQRGIVVFRHPLRQRSQAGRGHTARRTATIGLREKEHVLHDASHALQFFQVRPEHLAQFFGTARPAQRQFGAADQGGEWGAQLMRHIGIESF